MISTTLFLLTFFTLLNFTSMDLLSTRAPISTERQRTPTTVSSHELLNQTNARVNGTIPRVVSRCELMHLICHFPKPSFQSSHSNLSASSTIQSRFTGNVFTTAVPLRNHLFTSNHSYNLSNIKPPILPSSSPQMILSDQDRHAACTYFSMICQPPTDVDANINIAVAVFGVLTCLLNSFVIGRILSQNIKKVHQSKVFFFNMALADVYYGLSSVFYVLGAFELIDFEGVEKEHIVQWLTVSISFSSFTSLSHVLLITVDRFMATTFPLIHKIYVTRRKIILAVAFMSFLSLVLENWV